MLTQFWTKPPGQETFSTMSWTSHLPSSQQTTLLSGVQAAGVSGDWKQGSERVLAKKSEKCAMPSSMGGARRPLKQLRMLQFLVGGSGGPSADNFWIRGPQMVHSNAFLAHFTPTPIPPPPKKILFKFRLISRMVLRVGKKSLKSD